MDNTPSCLPEAGNLVNNSGWIEKGMQMTSVYDCFVAPAGDIGPAVTAN